MDNRHRDLRARGSGQAFLAGLLATCLSMPAAAIEIPPVPPASGNGVPPNVMFILDDSGSMTYPTMPAARRSGSLRNQIEDRSYVHNLVYYNPAITYQPWMGWDGQRLTGGTSYTSVYADAARPEDTINLTNSNSCGTSRENDNDQTICGGEQVFFVPKDTSRTDAAYLNSQSNYYRYRIKTNGEIWRQERGSNSWINDTRAKPNADRSEAEERENYATWFSYHRTRLKAAKAGASEAFGELAGENYRVGYTTIWQNDELRIPVGNDNGLFRGANREDWFERLFDAGSSGNTPLHDALDRAGKYYSDTKASGPYGGHLGPDNQQLQCRQNFAILTSDGYWNRNTTSGISNADNQNGEWIYGPTDPATGQPSRSYRYTPEAPYRGSNSVTLADVAMHYWKRDLRPDMANIVPFSPANPAFWQHMVTFGISIGLSGTLDQTSVAQVLEEGITRDGVALDDWPDPMNAEDRERIDDLLHAAVNGRGEFVAASDPAAFREGLRSALAAITDRTASASNVAASSTSLSADSKLFQATYVGGQWSGDLRALPIVDRVPENDAPVWRAAEQMPTNASSRKVFTHDGGGKAFTYDALSAGARSLFSVPAVGGMNAADLARRRIDYIRGDASHEQSNGGPFRNRYRANAGRVPLGDIIHSSPVHLANEDASAADALFVGANDGMLHAFDPGTGAELFAYVPAGLDAKELVGFTRPGYTHAYFVDGPITVSNRRLGNDRHILVGTLGRGGKGVYALDVSDAASFNAGNVMWDNTTQADTDADLGYVLGRPILVQLNNGNPGVIFGNGPNSASGKAVLFVLDLMTGSVVKRIDTGVGADNALGPPTGWDADGDGTVDFVYAGDMHGNVWKFDLQHSNPNQWDVALGGDALFTATDSSGNTQPITGAVAVALDPSTYRRWVLVGTGRLYNDGDLWRDDGTLNDSVQSIYGIHDQDGKNASGLGRRVDIAGDSDGLAVRTIAVAGMSSNGMPIRGFEPSDRGLTVHQKGWVVDLLTPPAPGTAEGERVVGEVQAVNGVMVFSTTIPSTDPCLPGGRGYLNALNAFTGASVPEHFFDVDGDGEFTDDEVGGGGQEGGVEQSVPVGSVDLGLGGNTDPGWVTPLVCVNGAGGGTGCLPYASSAISGRISWREILRN